MMNVNNGSEHRTPFTMANNTTGGKTTVCLVHNSCFLVPKLNRRPYLHIVVLLPKKDVYGRI